VETVPGYRLSRTDKLGVLAARGAASRVFPQCADSRGTGVVMATTVAGLPEVESSLVSDPFSHYRSGAFGRMTSFQASQVAECIGTDLGLEGPRFGVSVACASGAMAIALGARMVLDGAAPTVLAGGSEALCAFTLGGFNALQALDPEPCTPFDVGRRGLNLGEGAAVVVLESLERARARKAEVWSVLMGWGMSNDAHHPTAPHGEGLGLSESMIAAMRMADVDPEQMGYLNAHGTGTPLNDEAEVKAIESAFDGRKQPLPVSSTKSYMGHCLGAAGAIEAVVTILSLRSGVLPPTLRLANPIESEKVEWLTDEPRRKSPSLAIGSVSAFGTRRGLIDASPPLPATITRWPTRSPRRAYLVPRFKAGDIVPGLKTRRLDLLTVWAIVAAYLAIEDAGVDTAALNPARVAIIFGTGFGCLERSGAFLASANRYGYGAADPIIFPETLTNAPASHVARIFGFRGPNVTLSCRGVSGETALIQARSLLNAAEADLAIVLAGDMLTRPLYEWYEAAAVLSNACFEEDSKAPVPFSEKPSGFFPGEGMAAMVLERAALRSCSSLGAYARVMGGLAVVEPRVSFGSWGRSSAPTVELIQKLAGGATDIRLVVGSANGSVALDRLEGEVIRACFERGGGTIVSAPKTVSGEFEASGLLRLALALSGQGGFWDTSAFFGPDSPDLPSEVSVPDRGLGLLLGTSAGGGRAAVSLEVLPRPAPRE